MTKSIKIYHQTKQTNNESPRIELRTNIEDIEADMQIVEKESSKISVQ